MAFGYLNDEKLFAVRKAATDLGFVTDANLATLALGISPPYIGTAMVGASPYAKLLSVTDAMNRTRNLVGGEVPLAKWLSNAVLLAADREEEIVFRDALQEMTQDGFAPPAEVAPDVDDAPRTDGGSLEIQIDEDDTLGVDFLLRGAAAARSVAKLKVHRHFDGDPTFVAGGEPDWGLGTGWLIGPQLLITNHHVINARTPKEPAAIASDFEAQAKSAQAEFDYNDAASKITTASSVELVASDKTLDFAVLRLDDGAEERPPLRLRVNPLTRPPTSALQERVNVLQHPNGDPMRLGFRNNFVVTGSAENLSYLTDTAGGSSGSPIFDDEWQVAGLHRGWRTISGDPVDVWGKQIRQENYCTPVGLILATLADKHPDVRDEIEAGQAALVP